MAFAPAQFALAAMLLSLLVTLNSMIEDAERRGLIKPRLATLMEPTSGNTAISLAFFGIHKGYKVVAVMPASYSLERHMILRALETEIYLTDPAVGIAGLFAKAERLVATRPNRYMLNQAMNTMNPGAHIQSTGPEIRKDTVGKPRAVWLTQKKKQRIEPDNLSTTEKAFNMEFQNPDNVSTMH
ncbi:hypothetical protein GOP47_0018748 [Adiantum capillus-veneris]|uniref:Tryptophan synthase beta chain-like PALP domain-containing protein n=1 Tax=Adiantum capillus-veneris TaxID=13818 RepID=A0A9D4UDS3_ADICA|nr:hypothetical protein GOP47_0018748 [Adiantum capillus-veneris]